MEGKRIVFDNSLNYTVLRLLRAESEYPAMVRARDLLNRVGGALKPHQSKF